MSYRVSIDTEELVKRCVKAIREMPKLQKARLISQTADIHLEQAGVSHTERETRFTALITQTSLDKGIQGKEAKKCYQPYKNTA